MSRNRRYAALLIAAPALWLGFFVGSHRLAAQSGQETFKARLALVPSDLKTRPDITGGGTATAVLSGTKVTITGTFEGLKTAATMAQLRSGIATAVRGPVVQDLTITKATSGSISGSFDLTPQQADALRKGKMYVQLHSEKAPEGNLWGWLLK
jgi:hypothetical protein